MADTRITIVTGKFAERDMPNYSGRDWNERGFTIGIGG
jgi:urease accessory protein